MVGEGEGEGDGGYGDGEREAGEPGSVYGSGSGVGDGVKEGVDISEYPRDETGECGCVLAKNSVESLDADFWKAVMALMVRK
jgi:hypothetical protein